MNEPLQQRLDQLKSEFDSGQKMLADLELKQTKLRESLLRISGAVQVLEEELTRISNTETDNIEQLDVSHKNAS